MKAVIIEDELPAARLLEQMVRSLRPDWDVERIEGSVDAANHWFAVHTHPDVIFLDIQLTDGNSFLFLEETRPESFVIFTTAYDEYAIQAFQVNSIDYLLKPIRMERLQEALDKLERYFKRSGAETNRQLSLSPELIERLATLSGGGKKYRSRFLIHRRDRMFALSVSEIAYFYTENKVSYAVNRCGDKFVLDLSLDKLMEQLDPDRFFRTNRQTIVQIDAIVRIEPYFLNKWLVHTHPEHHERIFVSKEKYAQFRAWLNY